MRRSVFVTVSSSLAMVLGGFIFSQTVTAETKGARTLSNHDAVARDSGGHHDDGEGGGDNSHGKPPKDRPPQPPPPYNPYPPGILPSDLVPELERVLREVDFIEARALARWRALPPPTMTGQPPTTEDIETLGELMNYDRNISPNKNTACASCHMPYAAFSGPIPSVNLTMIAYPGSVHFRAGKRSAQRYPYAPPYSSTTKYRVFSSVETSGTHARPDIC